MTALLLLLLKEALDAGLSFRFADGKVLLSGKPPTPDLLERLRKEKPAITAHFEQARRELFLADVQDIWPGATFVADEEKQERVQFQKELETLRADNES